ncbi:MAG: M48 family metalloprotease [Alphaproteobacteria bacterium]|nr:M48 family metalloprotease [Alphaproteobacteria bacterium]
MAKIARLSIYVFLSLFITGLFCGPVRADDSITLISDAETQKYLADIVQPLYQAAGLAFNPNKIYIVRDNSLNAFVSDGNYMFVHTGTLIEAENTNELSGILAHETGHILGGHIVRQKIKMQKMQYMMLGSMIAAGAAAVSTGRGDAAMAVVLGSQSAALNTMLHYQVQEERSADESAVKLLNKTGQSTKGLLNFMNKIKQKNILSGLEENAYFRTHPMTNERISHFKEAEKTNHHPTAHKLDSKFAMVKAKIAAFLLDKDKVNRMYPATDNSAPARYARAVSAFRQGNIPQALNLIDGLLKENPSNPYFYELKGQFLFESGQVQQSIKAYEKALQLLPNNYLLQVSLAHALIESTPNKQNIQRAISLLQKSLYTVNTPFAWQLLARAYDMNNQRAASYYAAAEYSYADDNLETAKRQLLNARKAGADKSLSLKISDLEQRIKEDEKERE